MIEIILVGGGLGMVCHGLYGVAYGTVRSKFGTNSAPDENILVKTLMGKKVSKFTNPFLFWMMVLIYIIGGGFATYLGLIMSQFV